MKYNYECSMNNYNVKSRLKLIFIVPVYLLFFLYMPIIEAKTKVNPESSKIDIEEYCVNGYAFVIARDNDSGLGVSQVKVRRDDTGAVLPKQCDQTTGAEVVIERSSIRIFILIILLMPLLVLGGVVITQQNTEKKSYKEVNNDE